VTPKPNVGNPRPRIFRYDRENAIINRCGFNNDGLAVFAQRLRNRATKHGLIANPASVLAYQKSEESMIFDAISRLRHPRANAASIIGVNLGKNFSQEHPTADYVNGVNTVGQFAGYIVINVSSPNTPNLRSLQNREHLSNIIRDAQTAIERLPNRPPLVIKIAPDLTESQIRDVAEVALESRVDGIIVTNTTIQRPETFKPRVMESGGMSGAPLKPLSLSLLREMYSLTGGKIPLIGSGGIFTGQDAYERIRSGASLVQLYSAFIFSGMGTVPDVKEELAMLLKRDGFKSVSEAVGLDVPPPTPTPTTILASTDSNIVAE
jgi:dihydroorotate dehydrogenase